MPFFSIIIPIYNASATLPRCLKSVTAQSFSDYEVLLVDDGSTDASASVCRSLCGGDARFRYLHQENQGPSAARNAGLDLARGQWICFVDSDDAVAPDYLSALYERIEREGCDCVFMGYRRISADGTVT